MVVYDLRMNQFLGAFTRIIGFSTIMFYVFIDHEKESDPN